MTIHGWEVLSVVIAATFALIGVGEWFYRRSLIDAALHQNRLRAVIHRNPGSRASLAAAVELVAPDALITRFVDVAPGKVRIEVDGPLWWWERRAVIRAIRAETSCGVEVDFSIELRRP